MSPDKPRDHPTLVPAPPRAEPDADEDTPSYRPRWAQGRVPDALRVVGLLLLVAALLALPAAFWGDWRCAFVRCAIFPLTDTDTDGDGP